MRFVFFIGLLFAAYKVGEQKTRLDGLDFLLVMDNRYVSISAENGFQLVGDANLATKFTYWDAIAFRRIIRKTIPGLAINLEGISGVINANYQTV